MNHSIQFRRAATLGTERADLDIAGYWLRDADAAQPDPHYAVRLLRAVMTGAPGDSFRVASEWLAAAEVAYTDDQRAREQETPMQVVRAIRSAA